MEKIESSIRNFFYQFKAKKYHQGHKRNARSILNKIEAVKGKTDPKLIKLSDEYASDVLGWNGFAPWLYVYSAVSESFKEGWIPDNYYGRIVVPIIKGDYGIISEIKSFTNKLFKNNSFPNIASYVNGLWISNNCEILNEKNLKEILFKNSNKVVYKVDNSGQGKDVYFIDKDSFDLNEIKSLGNGIFQNFINQHGFFDEMMSTSVATIRMTTTIDNSGKASVRACYLRIGRETDTHVRSLSHIRIPIDLMSGELFAEGFTTDWVTIDKHPDSKISFAGKVIPHFDKCLSTAIDLHKLMPFVHCIGWDMIVDNNNNVKVMEWNGSHNDIKFSEATQGPCFSDLGWEKLRQKFKISQKWGV